MAILYDGTLDTDFPNALKITDEIAKAVLVYKKYIVILFDCLDPEVSDSAIIQKSEGTNYNITFNDDNMVFDPIFFVYDHIIFVICLTNNILHIIQPDTDARTNITIDRDFSHDTFRKSVLRIFLNMYARIPYGRNRHYDPRLMEYPKVISGNPKKVCVPDYRSGQLSKLWDITILVES